jgi:sterol 3beta-glucosyltransferase
MTLGSRGDVQPYVALGAALKARGHEATITTGRGFDDLIEAHGLASAPISDDVRELIKDPLIQDAMKSFSGKLKAWRHFKGEAIRQLDESWAITRDFEPDLIVFHIKMAGAPAFGEKLRIPALPSFLMPGMVATSAYPSPLVPLPNLGPVGNLMSHRAFLWIARTVTLKLLTKWQHDRLPEVSGPGDPFGGYDPSGTPATRLHAYSPHIVPKPTEWGTCQQITGAWMLDDEKDWLPPQALQRFLDAGAPPVYVGFGSMPGMDAARNTRAVLEALRQTGQRAILATGWGGLEETAVPETLHVLSSAPHGWLFPRCSAVVHHGGAGTTHAGLRAGKPTIICPVAFDQPFWGRRIAALGVGPDPIPQKTLSADKLAAALTAVGDPAMIARAETLGAEIRREPGTAAAVEIIEAAAA